MLKIKENDTTVVRLIKNLLQGFLIGGLIGGVIGFVIGYFDLKKGITLPLDMLLTGMDILTKVGSWCFIFIAIYYVYSIGRDKLVYEQTEDDNLSEELYRQLGKKIGYASVFVGVSIVLSVVNMVLTYRISLVEHGLFITFPWLSLVGLILASLLQMHLLKVNNSIRGIKTTLAPTLKELKNNVLQLDEAELQANYEMCFDIVMMLSGVILPGIYVLLMSMAIFFQKVELTSVLIAGGIHLYIMIMNFKLTKNYYK